MTARGIVIASDNAIKICIIILIVSAFLFVSGCMSAPGGSGPTPAPAGAPTPISVATQQQQNAGTTQVLTPGSSATGITSGQASDWGTDRDTYDRGGAATGWTYITNTGNVPITQIDFVVDIKRTVLFFPIEKSFSYSKTGLNIAPGEKQKVEFSQTIPADYQGMSTAGDYQLTVTAMLGGSDIGSFSRSIKIV